MRDRRSGASGARCRLRERRGQQRSPRRRACAVSASAALTRQPACRHATAAERVELATLPCAAAAGTILPWPGACSSSTTTAPSAQRRDSCSSGAASSSWPRPADGDAALSRRRRRTAPTWRSSTCSCPTSTASRSPSGSPRLDPAPEVILTSSLDGTDFGALVAGSPALGFIPEGRALGSRRSKRCSHRPR